MDKKDGGQAFPHGDPTNGGDIGMTLRDYFAAKAMQAIVGSMPRSNMTVRELSMIAAGAYDYADAMLAERAKERTP